MAAGRHRIARGIAAALATTGFIGLAAPLASATPVDRVDVTTWAYDRVHGDTYVASNNGSKEVMIDWKSYHRGQRAKDCTSVVTVSGPVTFQRKTASGCSDYNPGTYFTLRNPGVFVVTVTVIPKDAKAFTATKQLVILPYRSLR